MHCFSLTRLLLYIFCFLNSVTSSLAQYEEKDFIRYSVKEGLSDNNITCIQQDEWGYIWAGTNIGLNRFDGYQFKNFYQGSPGHFLASSNITKLASLSDHRIAIATRNGFQVLNTCNGTNVNYFIPDTTAFVTIRNMVRDVMELSDGSFAVSTASGFYHFNKNGSIIFRHDAFGIDDIGNKRILYGRNIFDISEENLLIYTGENGLAHYDPVHKVFHESVSSDVRWKYFTSLGGSSGPWISKSQISGNEFIFIPRADSIIYYHHSLRKRVASPLPFYWADEFTWESSVTVIDDSTFIINSGYAGFYFFHLDKITGIITIKNKKWLKNNKVTHLFQDRDGRLWAGTTQGLYQQNLQPGFIRKFNWAVPDFSNKGYTDGFYYKDKLYLTRYSRDAGLVIIDTATMMMEDEIHFYGKGNGWNESFGIAMYHPDTLWIGSYEGLLWFDTKSHRYGRVADIINLPEAIQRYTMLEPMHPDGYAWMLSFMSGAAARYNPAQRVFQLFMADTKPALPFSNVKGLAYDSYGDVWISGHSLARWNNKESYFDTLITVYDGSNKYNDDILIMTADDKGSLWLHNAENGLLEYKIKQKKFIAYSMKDGLPSDVLRCFSPVIDHTLWIGSHNHLTRFDTKTKKMEIFGYQEGLPDRMPIGRKIIPDAAGRNLLMFYVDEAIQFPVHPIVSKELSGDLLIEDVFINNNQAFVFPDAPIKLKSGENNISINFAIVDFENNHNYQFAYKLNNDAQWRSLGQQRNINLNNLSPGNYLLQISATGKSGEQKIKTLAFVIRTPFWKTGWFFIICSFALCAVIYGVYKSRISKVRQKANLDKLLSQTEMKALHAQMNPHFIFNSLNSIREMILTGDNNEASRFLSKFAHLIRITLDQSGQSYISLRNTVDYLERYIEMEKIRNNKFTCKIIVDPALEPDETILPPMLIQPFIENSIWHGATGNEKKIDIIIRFQKQADQLICIIEDNGIGIERSLSQKILSDTSHRSVGITNIESRILLLNKKHNLQSSITVEDKSKLNGQHETGTKVTLRLPIEIAFV